MKKDIHPKYDIAVISCACGNSTQTRSSKKSINVEICSSCHPFFTGDKKLVDASGRIERFKKRYEKKAR